MDTELYENILTEKSVCEIKNEEPVIILAKEKKESWLKLLKHKVNYEYQFGKVFPFSRLEDIFKY